MWSSKHLIDGTNLGKEIVALLPNHCVAPLVPIVHQQISGTHWGHVYCKGEYRLHAHDKGDIPSVGWHSSCKHTEYLINNHSISLHVVRTKWTSNSRLAFIIQFYKSIISISILCPFNNINMKSLFGPLKLNWHQYALENKQK